MRSYGSILLSGLLLILMQFMGSALYAQSKTIFGDEITKKSQDQIDEFRAYAISAMGTEITTDYEQNLQNVLSQMKPVLDRMYLLDEALGADLGPDEVNYLDDMIKEAGYDFTIKSLLQDVKKITGLMDVHVLAPIQAKIINDISEFRSKEILKIKNRIKGLSTNDKLDVLAKSYGKLGSNLDSEIKKLISAEERFSNSVISYVDANNITRENIDELRSRKKLVFAWDVLQYAQYKRYLGVLESKKQDSNNIGSVVELLSSVYDKLPNSDAKIANELIDNLYIHTELSSKHFDPRTVPFVPAWSYGIVNSCFNMYLAITIKDAVHLATNGLLFSDDDPRKDLYKKEGKHTVKVIKNGKVVDVAQEQDNRFVKFLQRISTHYVTGGKITLSTHAGTVAFVGSAELIRKIPASQIMHDYLGVSKTFLRSNTGKLVRGVSAFGISMAIGAKMAEIVGDSVLRWDSLFSDDPNIKDAARKLYTYQHDLTSKHNLKELSSFITSFGMAEAGWWLMGKGLSYPYKKYKVKAFNRRDCAKGMTKILDTVLSKTTTTRSGRFILRQINTSALFFVADGIDSRLIRPAFINKAQMKEYEKRLMELNAEVLDAEFNSMEFDIIDLYYQAHNEDFFKGYLETIYNRYDDYIELEPYVDLLRSNYAKVKGCLDIGGQLAFSCIQGFKDGSVDEMILRYSNNGSAKIQARKDAPSNVSYSSQETLNSLVVEAYQKGDKDQKQELDKLQKMALDSGSLAYKLMNTVETNTIKSYEANISSFESALTDLSFSEAKIYLNSAFDFSLAPLMTNDRQKFFASIDKVAAYYGHIGSDIKKGKDKLEELFIDILPELFSDDITNYESNVANITEITYDISSVLYNKLKKINDQNDVLGTYMCSIRRDLIVAHNDSNEKQFSGMYKNIQANKHKYRDDYLFVRAIGLLDVWGYDDVYCISR